MIIIVKKKKKCCIKNERSSFDFLKKNFSYLIFKAFMPQITDDNKKQEHCPN